MSVSNIICAGPGPHIPTSGILGTTDAVNPGAVYCSSTACQAALAALNAPAATLATNAATIQTNVQANMATIAAWLAANPNGAVLTAAQTKVLAKMLYGIGLILLQEFSSTAST